MKSKLEEDQKCAVGECRVRLFHTLGRTLTALLEDRWKQLQQVIPHDEVNKSYTNMLALFTPENDDTNR